MEWISIREQAPDTTDRVFVILISKGENQITIDRYFADRGLFKIETIMPGVEVTHWMKIPELPTSIKVHYPNKNDKG
jgi:hypothetical protein